MSRAALIFMAIGLLISVLFPILLAIYYSKKEKVSFKAVVVGAVTFFLSQIATRIPLLQFLSGLPWYQNLAANVWFLALFLSFTAGLFEEVGRFLGLKFFLRNQLDRRNGIAFGIGHGGIEAILLVGLTYLNNIALSIMINSGFYDRLIPQQLGTTTARMIKNQLIQTPPLVFVAGGLERVFTMVIHIALSLMVLYGITKKRPVYLLYAVLLHTAVNMPAVMVSALGFSIWFSELYLLVAATVGYLFIVRSREFFSVPQ